MAVCDTNFSHLSHELGNVFGTINLVIGLVALLGNLVALLVILKTKHFRNHSTCFLGSLIMTDFLVGVLLEPMHAAQLFSEGFRNNCIFNSARRYLSTVLIGASISSIALISYDRYTHLSRPTTYSQQMQGKKVTALITTGWLIPALIPILMKLGKDEQIYSGIVFLYIFVYFTIMVACYFFIIKIVRRRDAGMAESHSHAQHHRIKNDLRAAKAVATIIICFAVAIIPISIYHCTVAINTFLPQGIPGFKETSREISYTVGMTLAMANSGINPFIYYLRNPKFKEGLIKELKAFCPKRYRKKTTGRGSTG